MQNFDIAIETAESFYETDRLGKDPEISDAFFAYSKYDPKTKDHDEYNKNFEFALGMLFINIIQFDEDPKLPGIPNKDYGIHLYGIMINKVVKIYNLLKENKTDFPLEYKRILNIFNAFYFLEKGVCDKLGFEIDPITSEDQGKDSNFINRKLAQSDAGRKMFKEYLIWLFKTEIKSSIDRTLILRFANKAYYNIHCFQGPLRFDPKKAAEDAAGLSDHFSELVNEVIGALKSN